MNTPSPLRHVLTNRLRLAVAGAAALAALSVPAGAAALTANFVGAYNFGGGLGDQTANVIANVNTAIGLWNTVLPTSTHNLTVDIRLDNIGNDGNAGLTTYVTKDANGRVNRARLDFNSNTQLWFFDTTPFENSEFTLSATYLNNNGLSTAEALSGCQGPAVLAAAQGKWDFLSVAIHEIGHALGIGQNGSDPANFALYDNEIGDGDIDIDAVFSTLFAGGVLPVLDIPVSASHFNGTVSGGDYNLTTMADPGWQRGTRAIMTDLDILGIASVNDFAATDVNLTHLPEPATAAWLAAPLLGLFLRRRR